jgi:hypothetical protein
MPATDIIILTDIDQQKNAFHLSGVIFQAATTGQPPQKKDPETSILNLRLLEDNRLRTRVPKPT